MMFPCRLARERADYRLPTAKQRSWHMKWETPVAVDLRFGMEITMYVANR
jgi:coenzyme PQQ precursor peptide PqqA